MQARWSVRVCAAFSLLVVASLSRAAHAHFTLMMPPPADATNDGGKGAPPCGPTTASGVVTPVTGGRPLTIMLTETVFHPGHYRFALSVNSRTELPADPPVTTDAAGNSTGTTIQNPAVFPVLADGVFPHTTGTSGMQYQTTINLPNITCTKCTLQIIEYMNGHSLNAGGGYFYHHCADLAITAQPGDGGAPDVRADSGADVRPGTGGMTGTAGASGGGTGGRGSGGSNGTAGTAGGVGGASAGIGGSVGTAGQNGGTGTGGKGVGGSADAGSIDVVTPPDSGCGSCAVSTGSGAAGWTAAGLLIAGLLLRRRRRS